MAEHVGARSTKTSTMVCQWGYKPYESRRGETVKDLGEVSPRIMHIQWRGEQYRILAD